MPCKSMYDLDGMTVLTDEIPETCGECDESFVYRGHNPFGDTTCRLLKKIVLPDRKPPYDCPLEVADYLIRKENK